MTESTSSIPSLFLGGFYLGAIILGIFLGAVVISIPIHLAVQTVRLIRTGKWFGPEWWDGLTANETIEASTRLMVIPEQFRPNSQTSNKPVRQEPRERARPPKPIVSPVRVLPGAIRPDSPRAHVDQCTSHAVRDMLAKVGVDTTTSDDVGLIGASDLEQLAFALTYKRVLITHDRDFLRLHNQGHSHACIVHAPPGRQHHQAIVHAVLSLFAQEKS